MKRLFLVAMLVLASTAYAGDEEHSQSYRAVVDRVDLEPSTLTGYRLRIYLSALALQGQVLDLTDPKSIRLYLGAGEKKLPYALGSYGATASDTALVILVQASLDYTEALPMIQQSIESDLLANLPDRTQVSVLQFGDATPTGKLAGIKSARGKSQLSSDMSVSDPVLSDSIDRALLLLRKAKASAEGRPLRKMIVIVGDGRDQAGDRDRVTRSGERAKKDGVRIHTIAYSPTDNRRPMLSLGELSKKSLGTFRWVRKGVQDSWTAAFEQLRDEINKQYVVTYFVSPSDEVASKKLHIVTAGRTEATSNEVKLPATPTCGGAECTSGYCANDKCIAVRDEGGRGVLGWILLVGGIGVGSLLVLGTIGYFLTKKQQRAVAPQPGHPAMPGHAPVAGQPMHGHAPMPGQPMPGLLPNGRPIPALIIMSGPRTGERHQLFNGFLIGKQPGCHLLIEDGYTSSQHAQIGMDVTGSCRIYDRGSTNGTYVNGMRVTDSALAHGIVIKIGSTEIRFLAE